VVEDSGDIRDPVRLGSDYDGSRLSQEGILIREGSDSLLTMIANDPAMDFPFAFDLDVRNERCFELDAERARITDGQDVAIANLLTWIEERGLRLVRSIESSFFSLVATRIIMAAQTYFRKMNRG